MKTFIRTIIISALLCSVATAQQTTMREVKGQGADRAEAIKDALFQAVSQGKGVKVDSGDYTFGYSGASAGIDRQGAKRTVDFDAVSVQTGGTVFTTEIEGLVKTYEVTNEKKLDDGTYEVALKVWVYDHVPVDMNNRRRLAVMPVRTMKQAYRFGELTTPAEELSRVFSHKLNAGFAQTNKFAVMDREYIEEFLHEKQVLIHDGSLQEQSKLGEVLGTDYMLVGTISDARLEIKELDSAIVGKPLRKYEGDFVFDYKIIVSASRQVKFSDTVTVRLENDQIKRLVEDWEPSNLDYRELTNNLVTMVANKVVQAVIDQLYPIKIAAIENDQVVINQGGQHITKGMVLNVVSQGREITDPDTGESLGSTETTIARLLVEKVAANMSYARVVDGDISKITEGMVCRAIGKKQQRQRGRETQIQQTPQGGIRLPFDR